YAFLNDKANPRIFVIDLKDFETKQVIYNPLFSSSHAGAFVTPNTENVLEATQYPAPLDRSYVPLEQERFNSEYRGAITYHKYKSQSCRSEPENAYSLEVSA